MGAPVGNQNARKAKKWQQAIERALARATGENVSAGLDKAADMFVQAVFAGDQWALKELGDRLDGKPATVIIGDKDEDPIQVEGRVKLVRPND